MQNSITKAILFSKPMIALEIVIVVVFGFYVGKEFLERLAIEEEIAHLELQIAKLEYDKDDIGALIEYVATDAFVEQVAREKLNITHGGESVVVIPEVDSDPDSMLDPVVEKGAILGKSHMNMWWTYFFDNELLEKK